MVDAPLDAIMPVQDVPMPATALALLAVPDTAMPVQAVVAVVAAILVMEAVLMLVGAVQVAAKPAAPVNVSPVVQINVVPLARGHVKQRVVVDVSLLVAETAIMAVISAAQMVAATQTDLEADPFPINSKPALRRVLFLPISYIVERSIE